MRTDGLGAVVSIGLSSDVESFDGIWLRLSAAEPATCRITAKAAAMEAGLCRPASPALSPALAEGDSIAYLTLEWTAEGQGTEPRFRLGAVGYGPAGAELAERICAQIRAWSRKDRRPRDHRLPRGHTGQ